MDARVRYTNEMLLRGLLLLRKDKALENIKIKDLVEAAQINKATFYLHYKNLFDLEAYIENEMIKDMIKSFETKVYDFEQIMNNSSIMFEVFDEQRDKLITLTKGSFSNHFIENLDSQFLAMMKKKYPSIMKDKEMEFKFAYLVRTAYYLYMNFDKKAIHNSLSLLTTF